MGSKKPPKPKKPQDFENHPFEGLRGLARQAAPPSAPRFPLKPKPKPAAKFDPEDEQALFLSAIEGAQPTGTRSERLPATPKVELPRLRNETETEEVMLALQNLINGEVEFSLHETSEAIEGAQEGLDASLLARLRAGEFTVQDHLDLHGLTREEAHEKIRAFLVAAVTAGKRCVLLIHGRGHGSKDHIPVLKTHLKSWLLRGSVRKLILAFTTARPCDGGAGAIYLLLRKWKP